MSTPREVNSATKAERKEMYLMFYPENISPLTCNTWGTKPHRNYVCVTGWEGGGECSETVQCACAYVPSLPACTHTAPTRGVHVIMQLPSARFDAGASATNKSQNDKLSPQIINKL